MLSSWAEEGDVEEYLLLSKERAEEYSTCLWRGYVGECNV